MNVPFEEIDIGWTGSMWEVLERKTGMTTVPQILVDDRCIGGYDDLAALHRSGRWPDVFGDPVG